jgi:hypothetical protein
LEISKGERTMLKHKFTCRRNRQDTKSPEGDRTVLMWIETSVIGSDSLDNQQRKKHYYSKQELVVETETNSSDTIGYGGRKQYQY